MPLTSLYFGWCWMLLGLLTGVAQGLFFHRENWLGGYASWPRRMTRLGHVAFFGTGALNLLLAFTVTLYGVPPSGPRAAAAAMLIVGAVGMPGVCYLSAWRKPFRHLFPLPVFCLVSGVGVFLWLLLVKFAVHMPTTLGGVSCKSV